MTTLRQQLLARASAPVGSLALPELGGVVLYLRRWSLRDQLTVEELSQSKEGPASLRLSKMLCLCVCEEDGTPIGTEEALSFPADVVQRVVDAALKANGLGKEEIDRGKAISPPTPS